MGIKTKVTTNTTTSKTEGKKLSPAPTSKAKQEAIEKEDVGGSNDENFSGVNKITIRVKEGVVAVGAMLEGEQHCYISDTTPFKPSKEASVPAVVHELGYLLKVIESTNTFTEIALPKMVYDVVNNLSLITRCAITGKVLFDKGEKRAMGKKEHAAYISVVEGLKANFGKIDLKDSAFTSFKTATTPDQKEWKTINNASYNLLKGSPEEIDEDEDALSC